MNKYSDEDEAAFEEEYIDDDYGDAKNKAKPAQMKNDFWEAPKKQQAAPITKPSTIIGI